MAAIETTRKRNDIYWSVDWLKTDRQRRREINFDSMIQVWKWYFDGGDTWNLSASISVRASSATFLFLSVDKTFGILCSFFDFSRLKKILHTPVDKHINSFVSLRYLARLLSYPVQKPGRKIYLLKNLFEKILYEDEQIKPERTVHFSLNKEKINSRISKYY